MRDQGVDMGAPVEIKHCYDFPEIVIHETSGRCGRYTPYGICRPLPTPVEPYTEDEQEAVRAYHSIMDVLEGRKSPDGWTMKKVLGMTVLPDEQEYHD